MNAKIFELGRQATIWCCDNLNPDTPKEDWDAAWEQKFAELIVRECADLCEHESNDDQYDQFDMGMSVKAEEIKASIMKEFGIEE